MYNTKRQELQQGATQISELESEVSEHQLVLDTLNKARDQDPSRKCFRLVGGVLVERTVADAIPQLQANLQGLQQLLQQTTEAYKKKDAEFAGFIKQYNISVA